MNTNVGPKNPLKLNLGAGRDHYQDFTRVDISPIFEPDILCDFRKFPWPWEDNTIEYIRMDSTLEHFDQDTRLKVVNECHRILKPGGILWIRVPYLEFPMNEVMIYAAFTDPTHKSFFTTKTMTYWDKNDSHYYDFGQQYGCMPFNLVRTVTDGKFLVCELQK
jgi:predicted SAM-dependent methyltransferase